MQVAQGDEPEQEEDEVARHLAPQADEAEEQALGEVGEGDQRRQQEEGALHDAGAGALDLAVGRRRQGPGAAGPVDGVAVAQGEAGFPGLL